MTPFDDILDLAERRLDALPLEQMSVASGGRTLEIMAVRDHDRLLAAAGAWSPFPFGVLLWESALVLGDVLAEGRLALGAEVLELGAGTGVGGIVAAGLGGCVIQTDHSFEALALCRRNALANGTTGVALGHADWTDWIDRRTYDVVIGADILYETALHDDVLRVLRLSVRPGGMAILTDPGRMHSGRFVAQLREAGFSVGTQQRIADALPPCERGAKVAVDVIEARRL